MVVALSQGRIAGLMLFQPIDLMFWPEKPEGEAFYIHRLARARAEWAKGVTSAFIKWAVEEARAAGRPFLRLDCVPAPRLCALYERLGFIYVDEVVLGPDFVSSRYQMAVN